MKKARLILTTIIVLALVLVLYFLLQPLDLLINNNIPKLQSPFLNYFFIAVTTIGNKSVLFILSLLLVVFLLLRKRNRDAVFSALLMIFSSLLVEVFKIIFARPRPSNPLIEVTGYSFPSSHAVTSTAFFLLLIYLFEDKIKNKFLRILFTTICTVLAFLIVVSRIYLNAHWFSDVLSGFILGLYLLYSFLVFHKP